MLLHHHSLICGPKLTEVNYSQDCKGRLTVYLAVSQGRERERKWGVSLTRNIFSWLTEQGRNEGIPWLSASPITGDVISRQVASFLCRFKPQKCGPLTSYLKGQLRVLHLLSINGSVRLTQKVPSKAWQFWWYPFIPKSEYITQFTFKYSENFSIYIKRTKPFTR